MSYLEKRAERVAKHYGAKFKDGEEPLQLFHVSGFAHPLLNVITEQEPHIIQQYRWGLIPKWCQHVEQAITISNQTLNSKAETIFEKNSFKHSVFQKRCLVIVSGFFEWQTFAKSKYPYYITLKEQPFFSLAGLYENWTDKHTGEQFNTFSIITVDANTMMAQIHNSKKRMPLILPVTHEQKWLDSNLDEKDIQALLLPFEDNQMQAHTISKRINDKSLTTYSEDILKPFEYPELAFLQ